MNLKEAFRYQNFLDDKMCEAVNKFSNKDNAQRVTKMHLYSAANPDKEDKIEVSDPVYPYNADVIFDFMKYIVEEREKLGTAIGKAKASLSFDMDAAQSTNKFRQTLARAVTNMLLLKPQKRTEQGRDYKFNQEGNQMMYIYDIEVTAEDDFDREYLRSETRRFLETADEVSNQIDAAKINTQVSYNPKFSVNNTFDEMIEIFIEEQRKI